YRLVLSWRTTEARVRKRRGVPLQTRNARDVRMTCLVEMLRKGRTLAPRRTAPHRTPPHRTPPRHNVTMMRHPQLLLLLLPQVPARSAYSCSDRCSFLNPGRSYCIDPRGSPRPHIHVLHAHAHADHQGDAEHELSDFEKENLLFAFPQPSVSCFRSTGHQPPDVDMCILCGGGDPVRSISTGHQPPDVDMFLCISQAGIQTAVHNRLLRYQDWHRLPGYLWHALIQLMCEHHCRELCRGRW
ncbi:hypothetical protein O3P69_011292, partial [Scylla paramamosain]